MFTGDCEISFFGYFTNTGLKLILGIKSSSSLEEDQSLKTIKDMFVSFHWYMVQYNQNPFLDTDSEEEFKEWLIVWINTKVETM